MQLFHGNMDSFQKNSLEYDDKLEKCFSLAGYQKQLSGKWLKKFGLMLISIDKNKSNYKISFYFLGLDNKVHLWEETDILEIENETSILKEIFTIENYGFKNFSHNKFIALD